MDEDTHLCGWNVVEGIFYACCEKKGIRDALEGSNILLGATALAPSCHGLGRMLPRPWQGCANGLQKFGTP